jgi:hypothetical protein
MPMTVVAVNIAEKITHTHKYQISALRVSVIISAFMNGMCEKTACLESSSL